MTAKQLLFFYEQERLRKRRRFLASAEIDNPIVNDFGGGLIFDGVNDFVSLPNFFTTTTQDYSVNLWLKPQVTSGVRIVWVVGGTGLAGKCLLFFNGAIRIQEYVVVGTNEAISQTPNNTCLPNVLYNICIVKTGLLYKIFVNGIEQSYVQQTAFTSNGTTQAIAPHNIGVSTGNPTYNGDIYDFKIFNKALIQPEITTLFTSKGAVVPPTALLNLVSNYRFADKQGFVLSDISTNANNGILTHYTLQDVTLGLLNKWRLPNGTPALVL